MDILQEKQLLREKLSDNFFQKLTEYTDLIKREQELSPVEAEKLKHFQFLTKCANTVFDNGDMNVEEFFGYFHQIYIERTLDSEIDTWTFIQSLENILLFEIEEIKLTNTL